MRILCASVKGSAQLWKGVKNTQQVVHGSRLNLRVVQPPRQRSFRNSQPVGRLFLSHVQALEERDLAREHDDAMAFVQALTHFALLSFAYTFVRLDQDPADLLPLRTPVFEPLLYLASRVAYLARTSPDFCGF